MNIGLTSFDLIKFLHRGFPTAVFSDQIRRHVMGSAEHQIKNHPLSGWMWSDFDRLEVAASPESGPHKQPSLVQIHEDHSYRTGTVLREGRKIPSVYREQPLAVQQDRLQFLRSVRCSEAEVPEAGQPSFGIHAP